jgi:hypothetical protein
MHPAAPELFCLDLYRRFDLEHLQAIAGIPVRTRLAPVKKEARGAAS